MYDIIAYMYQKNQLIAGKHTILLWVCLSKWAWHCELKFGFKNIQQVCPMVPGNWPRIQF